LHVFKQYLKLIFDNFGYVCCTFVYANKYIHGAYLPAGSPLSYAPPKVNICTCKWHSRLPIYPLSPGASGPYSGSLFLFLQLLHFTFELCGT